MEIKKTNLHLTYKIEELAGGGFVARSEDPGVEPIEAASKDELLEKIRAKTAELVGRELPLGSELLKSSELNIGGANIKVTPKFTVNVPTKSRDAQAVPSSVANPDASLASQSPSGSNVWKWLFFVVVGLAIAWFLLHR